MPLWRAIGATIAMSVVNLNVATCRSTSEDGATGGGEESAAQSADPVNLEGIDTSNLTSREHKEWSGFVSELLAPCPDQPVSVAQCVKESRDCSLCLPAARFLKTQVTRGRPRSQTEKAFRLRFSPDTVKQINVGESPAKGAKGAPVTIVEWADFECPSCAQARPILDRVVRRYPSVVRLVFKHYPLSIHEHAETAARAAVAAAKQGKFWKMHEALFKNGDKGLDKKTVQRIAKQVGLDVKQFTEDLESEEAADAVNRDRKQGEKLGLRGTPMIYINGRHFDIELFSLLEDLDEWIELEAELVTGKKVEPVKLDGNEDAATAAAPAPSGAAPAAPAAARSAAPAKSAAPAGSAATPGSRKGAK